MYQQIPSQEQYEVSVHIFFYGPGTELVKPGQKLVELVALAIDESPDGVLQVQQVYSYLM